MTAHFSDSAVWPVWLAFLAPLVGCVLIALGGDRIPRRLASVIACAVMLVSFVLGVIAFLNLQGRHEDRRMVHHVLWTWLSSGEFHVNVGILYDPLSAVMLLVVSGVGFLIHVYSIGYMNGDDEERRFFAYLNLFVFSMLILVLVDNFVLLLAGWGMVGLSSYLLIGFWHERPAAVAAAKKAFVMNAIGDVGLAIGIFLIFRELGTVDYLTTFAARSVLIDHGYINWVCLLLLVGGVAKSAQLPLHTWLPDAMEGPTPVSALIHAATMVTAGVYLIARMNPLYSDAPDIQHVIVVIGVAGLLMAGVIGLFQYDIKRIIAYSTMSQIAYMFVGVGLGAYWTGIFHLVTHAFFKALLFMGAGVVIHALHDEQDIRNMGGLRRWLPRTNLLMWIGTLALVGIFPLSGGFSKDAILASGLEVGGFWGYLAWGGGLIGAFLTGLYGFRLIFTVFSGEPTAYAAEHAPVHTAHGEGPRTMMLPLYVLAALAVVGGLVQVPGVTHAFSSWLETTTYANAAPMVDPSAAKDWLTTALAVVIGAAGSLLAYRLYGARRAEPEAPVDRAAAKPRLAGANLSGHSGFARAAERRFYFDDVYSAIFYRPAAALARAVRLGIERPLFEGSLDAVAPVSRVLARGLGAVQTGIVRVYVLAFALGVAGLVLFFMLKAA